VPAFVDEDVIVADEITPVDFVLIKEVEEVEEVVIVDEVVLEAAFVDVIVRVEEIVLLGSIVLIVCVEDDVEYIMGNDDGFVVGDEVGEVEGATVRLYELQTAH